MTSALLSPLSSCHPLAFWLASPLSIFAQPTPPAEATLASGETSCGSHEVQMMQPSSQPLFQAHSAPPTTPPTFSLLLTVLHSGHGLEPADSRISRASHSPPCGEALSPSMGMKQEAGAQGLSQGKGQPSQGGLKHPFHPQPRMWIQQSLGISLAPGMRTVCICQIEDW